MNQNKKINYSQITVLLLFQLLCMSTHATIFTVTNGADAGVGSLRQAIIDANNDTGADEVNFDIGQGDCDGAGVCHINVASDLPSITDALIIDGTTQPQFGTAPDNVCATDNTASYMRIELNNTSSSIDFIVLNSPEPSVVKGLSIGGEISSASYGIALNGNAEHWVNCNHLGVNAQGTEKLKVSFGVCLSCAPQGSNGIVGTNSDGIDDISERNVIAASTGIYHNSFSNYIIAGNYFGLTADGLTGLESSICIYNRQSASSKIGSNLDGVNDSIEKNLFGNCGTGVFLTTGTSSSIMVTGNWFGLNANGTSLANGTSTAINLDSSSVSATPSYLVASNWIDSAVVSAINIKKGAQLSAGSNKNCITNSTIGLTHSGTSIAQPFTNNYWGETSGPSGIGTGTGAEIVYTSTGSITFDPWSSSSQICQLNNAPITTNASYTLNEDGTLTADDLDGSVNDANDDGVLANDSDVDGDLLTAVLDSTTANGALTLNADGSFSYVPTADYCDDVTPDTFTYHANDTQHDSNISTASITVSCVNDIPVASNDSYTLNEDGTLTADDLDGSVNDANDDGVLANDSDVDGDSLSVLSPGTFTATGIGGSITIAADGTFVYTSPTDVSGIAGLNFDVTDSLNVTSSSLSINVFPVNDAPRFVFLGNVDATNLVGVGNTQVQITGFAKNIVLGPADENTQNVEEFNLIVADSDSILNAISLSNSGTLNIDFSLNFGMALIEATLKDDGGTANGGNDTSSVVEFVVTHFDLVFADGFESNGGFRLFDYLDSLSLNYPLNTHPNYNFDNDNLQFYGHNLQLNNNYESQRTLLLVKYWMQEVLVLEDPSGDFDKDGILNKHDRDYNP